MRFQSYTSSLWAAVAYISFVTSTAASDSSLVARQSTTCSDLHIMIAGGCGIPCAADVPSYFVTLINNITAAFPASDQYFVPYNGSQYQAQVSTPLMIEAANEYFDACPNTPVVFVGYSLGGVILMNTLCGGISPVHTPNVIAAIAYGEETYTYPQTYDYGTCTNSAPKFARANTAACDAYAPIIHSYCDVNDPQCCGGTDNQVHFEYPEKYDLAAVAFVKAQYTSMHFPKSSSVVSTSSSSASVAPSSTSQSSSAPAITSASTISRSSTAPSSTSPSTSEYSSTGSTSSRSMTTSPSQSTSATGLVSSPVVKPISTSDTSILSSDPVTSTSTSTKSSTTISKITTTLSSTTATVSTSSAMVPTSSAASITSTTTGKTASTTSAEVRPSVTPYTGSASGQLAALPSGRFLIGLALGFVAMLFFV